MKRPGEESAAGLPRVLIVDESPENRDVLRTVLRSRGITTCEASESRRGLELARRYQPRVIVLDGEVSASEDGDSWQQYQSELAQGGTNLVVLGTLRSTAPPASNCQVVAKPYHYAPLIRTIESLARSG